MIKTNVTGAEISQEEINEYIKYCQEKYKDRKIQEIDIKIDGEDVDLACHFEPVPIQRIRRITGYLVGTVDRFNNAKRAEESQRVKHSLGKEIEQI